MCWLPTRVDPLERAVSDPKGRAVPYTVGMVRRLDVDVLSVVRGLNAIWTGIRADPAVSCGAVSLPCGSANPRGVVGDLSVPWVAVRPRRRSRDEIVG